MYLVVSLWKIHPGKLKEAEERSLAVREALRTQDGIQLFEGFQLDDYPDDRMMAVVGYQDRETYERLIKDPNGPFAKALEKSELEEVTTWVESWRGEALER